MNHPRISVFSADGRLLESVQSDRVAGHLATIEVDYERWAVKAGGGNQEQVLASYAAEVARLSRRHGYHSVDVVRMTPDHPDRAAARAKFREEHTHDDDETRFFVEGGGTFYLRVDDRVHAMCCGAGDLLRVPAGLRHWFDMGETPSFCAIRLFTRADGWAAAFTGDPIARRIPGFDQLAGA